jgi:hypothetical protein
LSSCGKSLLFAFPFAFYLIGRTVSRKQEPAEWIWGIQFGNERRAGIIGNA